MRSSNGTNNQSVSGQDLRKLHVMSGQQPLCFVLYVFPDVEACNAGSIDLTHSQKSLYSFPSFQAVNSLHPFEIPSFQHIRGHQL